MKKTVITLCLALTAGATQAQWSTSLNSGTDLKLGTSDNHPLDLYTYGTNYMTLGTDGSLKLRALTGSDYSPLYIDANGVISRAIGMGAPNAPCISGAMPWSMGGNTYPASNTIGTCSNTDFILKAYDKQSLFVKASGYVGIGLNNSSPQAMLDVSDRTYTTTNTEHIMIYGDLNGSIESTTQMNLYYKTGTQFSLREGSFTSGSPVTRFLLSGSAASLAADLTVSGLIKTSANNDNTLALNIYNSSSTKNNFKVYTGGKTQIGDQTNATNSALVNINLNSGSAGTSANNALDIYDQYDQKVNFRVKGSGFVYAREVNVQLTTFPDYVFEKGYNLQSLESLEKYIAQNKHLPGVPSASEVKESGVNLGELNRIQMEKIEELTLYVIELKKEIEILKKEKNN